VRMVVSLEEFCVVCESKFVSFSLQYLWTLIVILLLFRPENICKDYEVIERRNLGRERGRDIFVKTM